MLNTVIDQNISYYRRYILFRIHKISRSADLNCVANVSPGCEMDGWCNLKEYFPGTSMRATDSIYKGIAMRRTKIKIGSRRGTTGSLNAVRLPSSLNDFSSLTALSCELSLTTTATRQQATRKGRETSRAIKNVEESEKEQKYRMITHGGSRYYWKLLTQWKWAIGIAGGPRGSLLLLFSTLPITPASYECTPHRPEPLPIKTRRLWTPFLPSRSRNVRNDCRIIVNRRQSTIVAYSISSHDDKISISNNYSHVVAVNSEIIYLKVCKGKNISLRIPFTKCYQYIL